MKEKAEVLRECTQSLTLTRKAALQKSSERRGERKELRIVLPFVMFVFILFVFPFNELSIR